ncbi:MAG: 2-hydroxyacid dehydrogenase [Gemmataceae bacterium]
MADLPRVFVSRLIPEVGLNRIQQASEAEVWTDPLPPKPGILAEKIVDCEGLVSLLTDKIDDRLMDQAPKLKVISNFAVGFNNIDIPAATERGIVVGNTPGVLTDATADMAFCLMIAAARRVVEGHQYTLSGSWKTWEPLGHLGQELVGKTVGVVGMGRIGYAFAKRCFAGWDMNVIYHDVKQHETAEKELKARKVDLNTLLAESDFVSLHVNLDESTKGMISTAQFQRMRDTAVLVNTARGPLVDQKALYEALKSGKIFAAGLDVTDPEPPLTDDPLLALPNVVVAPHIASATIETRNNMANICADNLIAGLNDQVLPAWVNPDVAPNRRR